jgi:hypothetical protein
MTREEKDKARCSKCGEYFHSARFCDRPGPLCYNKTCHEYGHKADACPKNKKKTGNNTENENSAPYIC